MGEPAAVPSVARYLTRKDQETLRRLYRVAMRAAHGPVMMRARDSLVFEIRKHKGASVSFAEMGEVLGLSRERVRQLHDGQLARPESAE